MLYCLRFLSLSIGILLSDLLLRKNQNKRNKRKLEFRIRNKRQINDSIIQNIINSLNKIYSEIHDNDTNFWSKYSFWVWILFGSIINTFLYLGIFSKAILIIRVFFTLGSIIFMKTLVFIIKSAASAVLDANKTHDLTYSTIFSTKKIRISRNFQIKAFISIEKNNFAFIELFLFQ